MAYKNRRILAIIPARGGSKRLPRKNLLPLDKKPLIVWTIEAALSSKLLDSICVSTDDEEIASVSRAAGADVPFIRPQLLASDTASSADVVLHALEYYLKSLGKFDYLILLQPTSPLRNAADITRSVAMAIDRNADAVVGMSPCEHSPLWATILPEDDSLNESFPDNISGIRSQDLPQFFRINGALYVCKTDFFLDKRTFLPATNGYAYRMPAERSIDIDTMADFKYAEAILTSGDIR